jgi:hypothetical protein
LLTWKCRCPPRTRRRSICASRNPSSPPVTAGQPPRSSCMAQVHAKTGWTEPVRRQVRQQSGSGEGPGRAGRCHGAGETSEMGNMTQPLTATAHGYQQRPATAHNARTIGANLGYVRPENGRSVAADGHDPEYTRNAPDRLNDQRSSPGRHGTPIIEPTAFAAKVDAMRRRARRRRR